MFPLNIEQTYQPDAAKVAAQNDMFRKQVCLGVNPTQRLTGICVMTSSLSAMSPDFIQAAAQTAGYFDTYDPENDPDGYHDFGAFNIEDQRVYFKIDLFERGSDYRYGAETPDNPDTSERVMTLMLARDW